MMMRSRISIEVEFLNGTSIEEAVIEAKEMAAKLNVAYVTFQFNESFLSIGRNADVDKVVTDYKSDKKHIVS